MKKLKKQTTLILILVLLITSPTYGEKLSREDLFYINKIIGFFPETFYSKDSQLNKNHRIFDFENKIKSSIKTYIADEIYYSKIETEPAREIFFSDKSIDYKDQIKMTFENRDEFISNYYNKNYFKAYIKNNTFHIQGVNTNCQSWSLYYFDKSGKKINPSYLSTMPIINNRFSFSFKLKNIDDIESITISLNRHKLNKYYPDEYNIFFDRSGDEIFFKNSPSYEKNKINYQNAALPNPNSFLSLDHIDRDKLAIIKEKAEEITQRFDSDYEKVLAIHSWVAGNIYYDMDSITNNKRGPNDAFNTLADEKAVCQGYAELALALTRSIGIPTKLVYGYALGVASGEDQWNEESLEADLNHAWNEAYVDGRWIIFDTTWDSSNRYENKEFKGDKHKLRYFDPSLKAFSQTHRIIKVVDI